MPRVLLDTFAGVLSGPFVGLTGVPVTPTAEPTVTCTSYDGTVLAAPDVSPAEGLAGRYYAALTPAHTSQLDVLELEWTATVDSHTVKQRQTVYVCEDVLLTAARLYGEPDMATKPAWLLVEVADELCDYCEHYCNVAFGQRLEREVVPWQRGPAVALRWASVQGVLSYTGDGNPLETTLFDLRGSVVYTGGGWPWTATTIVYRHGRPVPPKLAREALKAAREEVLQRAARSPRMAISEVTGGTTVRYSTPNYAEGRPTGFLTLDPVLEDARVPIGVG